MRVLVINCGSSSIKYRLYGMPEEKVLSQGLIENIGEKDSLFSYHSGGESIRIKKDIPDHQVGLQLALAALTDKEQGVIADISEVAAVGHRVVHGGEQFSGSMLIGEEVLKGIEGCADLAPLHNPPNLAGIKAARKLMPGIPQVAAFDTAFHQTLPPKAYLYAFPYEYYEKHHLRRYGFHGTSHRYVARRAAQIMDKSKEEANIITCHLGNGCSITAIKRGKSVDTSMGLTPLEGLVMGTRCGDIDPAITFYLVKEMGLSLDEVNKLLNKKSGLLGVSGISNDMRQVLGEAKKGNERAKIAVEIFCYRLKKYIGSYMAVLGKVDGLVFTGGIGENAVDIRSQTCRNLEKLGIELDEEKNRAIQAREGEISKESSPIKVFVIPTNEEDRIAYDTYEMVK